MPKTPTTDPVSTAAPAHALAVGAITHAGSLRRLWWAAIVLLIISASAIGSTIWQLREDAIRAAISETGNIATVLAGQLSRSLQSIDTVLVEVQRSVKGLDLETAAEFEGTMTHLSFRESLKENLSRLPQVFNIAIADAEGRVIVSTASWPAPKVNIADRDYFQNAREAADGQFIASIPINNRIDGKKSIVFARPLRSEHGLFLGVIYASVNTSYFEDIYGSVQSVNSLLFTLVRQDGVILFRHPYGQDAIGRKLSAEAEWLASLRRGQDGFQVLGQADGNVRFVSTRPIGTYPLFANVSVNETTALAGWRRRSAMIEIGSSAFLLCALYLLLALTRQVRFLSRSEASLTQKSQQLDVALNNMSQGLSMFDGEHRLIVCNRQYAKLYGLRRSQVEPGTSFESILKARLAAGTVPEDEQDFLAQRIDQANGNHSSNHIEKLRDGRIVSVFHQAMGDGGGWVAIHQDITAQKRVEAELAHLAHFDILSGLPNRVLFMNRISEALSRLQERNEAFSILMLDLDRFKTVNDSLGHPVGDTLLTKVAARLKSLLKDADTVARLGGDEFAILLQRRHKLDAIIVANRILDRITEPYDLEGRRITIGTSIGVTLAPADGTTADALIKNADLALYRAKSEGGNRYCFFEPAMEREARERRELEDDLRKAVLRNEFELHYQTVVDLRKNECCGAEALVRWNHAQRGLINPDEFIALAEESGLIVQLGEWVLRKACLDAVHWPSPLTVAVNLSPAQIKQSDLTKTVRAALTESGLPPHRLVIEITETVLVEKTEQNLAVLHDLKRLGVSIVLDDFGIGYSSMRYLQMFPFDEIKIDKSFTQSMTTHTDTAAIVCAIAGLGRTLNIETTAEGVESMEQLNFLRGAGCRRAQGFLFSRPVPLPQLSFAPPEAAQDGAKAA